MFLVQSLKYSRIAFLKPINMAFKLSPNLTNEDDEKILINFILDSFVIRNSMEKLILFIVDRLFHQLGIKSAVLKYGIMSLMQSLKYSRIAFLKPINMAS
jgi:hypothetical protein